MTSRHESPAMTSLGLTQLVTGFAVTVSKPLPLSPLLPSKSCRCPDPTHLLEHASDLRTTRTPGLPHRAGSKAVGIELQSSAAGDGNDGASLSLQGGDEGAGVGGGRLKQSLSGGRTMDI